MEHISSLKIRKRFGLEETVEDVIAARRLRWLGQIARMEDSRLPKKFLFGWLSKCRPAHGMKMRWRDRAKKDLKQFGITESSWYHIAQDSSQWRSKCRDGLDSRTKTRIESDRTKRHRASIITMPGSSTVSNSVDFGFTCPTCKRSFRRTQDIARHKCVTTQPRR